MIDEHDIRLAAILGTVSAYGLRVAFVGNGTVDLFNYQINPFALALLVMVVLALPETIDMLPFGPTRNPSKK